MWPPRSTTWRSCIKNRGVREGGTSVSARSEAEGRSAGPKAPRCGHLAQQPGVPVSKPGEYGKAEPLYLRALKLTYAALCRSHPDVAESLNNLATLYKDQGEY